LGKGRQRKQGKTRRQKTNHDKKPTTIKNRSQTVFEYTMKGNEQYVPQIPNEDDYFDWDVESGDGIKCTSGGSTSTYNREVYAIFLRRDPEKCIIKKLEIREPMSFGGCALDVDKVDFDKTKDFFLSNSEMLYDNYAVSHGWLRCPPIKRSLLQ
jgi:hypothetical protein